MKHRLLLVEDDALSLETYKDFFTKRGYLVDGALSGEEAIQIFQKDPKKYSLVIVDYRMEGKNGADVSEHLARIHPDIYILIYSADSTQKAILLSTRRGARGFVHKSEGLSTLLSETERWCQKFEATHAGVLASTENSDLTEKINSVGMVGQSVHLARIAENIQVLKKRKGTVLILGESGTGKELVAQALHHQGPFKAVNCGRFASNPQLLASFLFGSVKGAFTGATENKKGLLEEAGNGTVFFDEVDTLPMESQVALLRVLQEKVVLPVGSTKEIPVHFRLVASAKSDLPKQIESGNFKEDLFYRLSRSTIHVPPLRERLEDIEPLVKHLCDRWNEENGEYKVILKRVVPYFLQYTWPGNVRELENVVFNLLDTIPSEKIGPEHLDTRFFSKPNQHSRKPMMSFLPLRNKVAEVEKEYLIDTLKSCQSVRQAASKLEIPEPTLRRLLKKHEVVAIQWLMKKQS